MAQAQTTPGATAIAAASLAPRLPPAAVPQSPRASSNGEGDTVSSHTLERSSSPNDSQGGASQSGSMGSWEVVPDANLRLDSGQSTPSSRGLRTPISGFVTPTEAAADGQQEPCDGPNWFPEDSMELDALLSQNLELGCLWVAGVAVVGAALSSGVLPGSDGSGGASPVRSKPSSVAGSGAGIASAMPGSSTLPGTVSPVRSKPSSAAGSGAGIGTPLPLGSNSEPRMSLQNFLDEDVPRFPFSRRQHQGFRDMRVHA